jgi:hypothetical protein
MEYEFTVFGELDLDHRLNVTKSRCSEIAGKVFRSPGAELAKVLKAWLDGGAPEAPKPELKPATRTVHVVTDDDSGNTRTVEVPVKEGAPLSIEQLRSAIAAATSLEALQYVIPEIKRLPEADQDALRKSYRERRDALKAAGAVEAQGPKGAEFEAGPAGATS